MTQPPPEPLRLRFHAISDVGRVRKDNQDSGYAGPWLLAVCDGVGGAARGDIASSTAIGELRDIDHSPDGGDLVTRVSDGLHAAHQAIGRQVDQDPALNGTSTTATVALFDGHRIGLGHVGDSRAYLFRDGELSQLTNDHTFVQSLIDEGRITEEEARVHPHRNLILKALDGLHEVEPDLFALDLVPGDRLFLCSDGACGVLEDGRMADILSHGSPEYAAIELVRSSLDAGSSDNVTCIVADVVGTPRPAAEPADPAADTLIPPVTEVDTVEPPSPTEQPQARPEGAKRPTGASTPGANGPERSEDRIAPGGRASELVDPSEAPTVMVPRADPDPAGPGQDDVPPATAATTASPADTGADADEDDLESAVPMIVGAAADPKRRLPRGLFRGHRSGDTGELEPVDAEIPEGIDWVIQADPPFDPEAYRYAPRAPRRFAWARRLLSIAIGLGIVWVLLAGAYWWTQQQYYVGEDSGQVVIYRGIDGLPGLSSVYRVSDLSVDDLPEGVATDVTDGIPATDYEDAADKVRNLAQMRGEDDSDDGGDGDATDPADDATDPTDSATTRGGNGGNGGTGGGSGDQPEPGQSNSMQGG